MIRLSFPVPTRVANIIAVVGYLAIIVNFTIVNMYFPGMHSYSGLVAP